jgi:hypothetical protein
MILSKLTHDIGCREREECLQQTGVLDTKLKAFQARFAFCLGVFYGHTNDQEVSMVSWGGVHPQGEFSRLHLETRAS